MQIFLQRFDQYWAAQIVPFIKTDVPFVVGISGGIDSIVLAQILSQKGFDFVLAHCNFHLRNEESDRDENFVRNFAASIQKKILVKDADTIAFATQYKIGIEEAARNIRYDWFRALAQEVGTIENPAPIFVAHHANDSIETLLINFFRGCGIAGMHGILPVNEGIFRPFLFASRKDILDYARSQNLQWVEDSTNQQSHYLRNFFRNDILPELKNRIPSVENNLRENIERFKEVEFVYKQYFSTLRENIFEKTEDRWEIDIKKLQDCQPLNTTIFELFQPFSFSNNQTQELIKLLTADTGAQIFSKTYQVSKNREKLIISKISEYSEKLFFLMDEQTNEIILDDNTHITIAEEETSNINRAIVLDKSKLQFPLQFRHWKEGDHFYPIGMTGKKKLSNFFIDLKIPRQEKDHIWLLTSDEKIVWVIGYRMDRRFVATQETTEKIIFTLLKK